MGPQEIVELAERAAARAEYERSGSRSAALADAIRASHADLSRRPELDAADVAANHFPNDPLSIVPLAIALATVMDSARSAILLAANVGGDSDSVASIAGAILGARFPESVSEDWYAVVEVINDHRLVAIGEALSALRS
jgi:ADP-ribosylglycohydrolase